MQETGLRAEAARVRPADAGEPRISLVVDRPAPAGPALLILPFAAVDDQGPLGRHIGLLLQRRLNLLTDLVAGHGLLIAVSAGERSYLPLHRPLSPERALACAGSWGARVVLSGAITLRPTLRWSLRLQDVISGTVLFEDTLVGEPDDLPHAIGDVALVVAESLGLDMDAALRETLETPETLSLPALLAYLEAADLRPQHGLAAIGWQRMYLYLLRALALDPAFGAPAAMLITDLAITQDSNGTLPVLIEALGTLGPQDLSGASVLAQMLEERGYAEQSAMLATAVLERDPRQVPALDLAAGQAYRAGQFSRARQLVQTLLELQPEHAGAYELLGNLLAGVGRYPGAAQHWEIAATLDPSRHKALLRLGSYLAAAGDYPRAFDVLSRAAAQGSSTSESFYQLGKVAYRLGRVSESIAALHQSLLREAERAKVHALLAHAYVRAGRDDLALVHNGRARELSPDYWPATLAIGHEGLRRGRIAEALEAYTQVARVRPDLAEALHGLGQALVASNLVEAGLEVLGRAYELRPNDLGISRSLVLTLLHSGRAAEAQRVAAAAVTLAPDSTLAARLLGHSQRYGHRRAGPHD